MSGANAHWEVGDAGCARFVLELRRRIEALDPGQRLRITARHAEVAEDLAAWCRMTGHRLMESRPPHFLVERLAAPPPRTRG